ncbi:MAG: MmgE/PrpD family protein [Rhodocyclaceae bacterium]|jgi:2-methylcitrate dehydratase PrpD|nr:MmgE/PrpD family protein [Rhodocyclaceae bacterium]MCE2978982.1 MmgE/PrpD family protein [Betaproteobacteria bacterium]MCA3075283.1 MmgE/PrpD family protein [Rhodocyclaceae bacterium]MCA3088820.1 MmgE/PrpD family protein [Rhodocyclaceae bacterium]MCA3092396.1 MmgE/PrpD family protein [Rhodocyclaceae bacterium]
MEEVTRILARYVVESRFESIPTATRHHATRTFVNWLGCAIGGSHHEGMDIALAALAPMAGAAQASVLGRGERLDILHAALLNGISSHMFDFDDTHLKTVIHPAGPVCSAILALAEHRPVSGEDFVHALVLGVEVECRIGNSVYPNHYDTGWHITGTAGVMGAAAACGKLLGLNEQQMVWALGIAATQSSGLREMFGTMCKPFHPGNAAKNGLMSALLAEKNFTSSNRGIEAPRGFAHVLSTKFDPSEIIDGLGKTFEIDLNTYKPFACGIVIHPIIDACVQLRNEHKLAGDEIESVLAKVHPLVLELTGKKTPQTGLEGKFSVYHSAAAGFIYGAAGEREYSDAVVRDARVIALRDKVTAVVDTTMHEDQTLVEVKLKDGRTLSKYVEAAIGSLKRPQTDADLEAKFRGLAEDVLPKAQVDKVLGLAWKVGALASAGDVAAAARK